MAEAERTFLGLTHNPFVEPHRGFFERGGRKRHLEQLRHLSQWSRRVLLVTGVEGVGKTTLYRELAATLEPRVKAARINGSLVNTGFEVLSAVAQGFGLAIPSDANTQSLRMDLIAHVEGLSGSDRLCLTLVDDAHLLDNRAVESLIALTHESAMHLVLFGEVRMVSVIERAASARGVGWQEIRLTGYGEADARDYLEWRFSQARYRGRVPFTDNEVKNLIKLSEGLPGRINQMANVLLVKLETGEGIPPGRGFPKLHAALLTLLVVVVGLLYLLAGEPTGTGPSNVAAPAVADASPELDSAEVLDNGPAADLGLADIDGVSPPAETSGDTWNAEPEAAAEEQTSDDDSAAAAGEPEDLAAVAALDEAEAVSDAAPADDVSSPGLPSGRQPEMQSEPEPEPATSLAEQRPEPEPAEEDSLPAAVPPVGSKDSSWLLAQDPDYFTIQLVTVSSPESASAFVSRQLEPGEFAVYQLQRDGRVLHVVLYGLFSSRDAAEKAADNLPPEVGRVQPWIRPVGQVQAAARLSTLN